MPGFASYDDLINEITTNGKLDTWNFFKAALGVNGSAGFWQSLWTAGGYPAAGSNPASGAGTSASSATVGGMFFPNVSADLRFGLSLGAVSSAACTLMIYDRLIASCLSGTNAVTTTGSKTVTMTAPRYTGTNGYGNQVWVETTTQFGTNALNIALNSYTDADSTGSLSGAYTAIATANSTNGYFYPLPLSGGKRGVTAVSTVINSGASAPTAGVCNIVMLKPLVYLPLAANTWNEKDLVMQLTQLPRIEDGACLGFAVLATGANQNNPFGQFVTGYG